MFNAYDTVIRPYPIDTVEVVDVYMCTSGMGAKDCRTGHEVLPYHVEWLGEWIQHNNPPRRSQVAASCKRGIEFEGCRCYCYKVLGLEIRDTMTSAYRRCNVQDKISGVNKSGSNTSRTPSNAAAVILKRRQAARILMHGS
jgi:hypothetical protein